MKMKNDCQVDYIKEAFDKLYNRVMPYIDLTQFSDASAAFNELDKKVHSEIYILKKCLAESDRAVDAGITRSEVLQERISDLESENNAKQHAIEFFDAKVNDLRVLRCDDKKLAAACEENNHLREVIDGKEKEINSLKKKIHELEQETADDAIRIKSLERANSVLRGDNKILWSKLEEADIPEHHKRPWHGDANAMTDERTCHKPIVETIEELNAKKTRLEENVDLSPGHEFEFGDEVFVPWSCDPYMYIKSGQLYNPRTERLVYVGKGQHLKWFGEKFSIV